MLARVDEDLIVTSTAKLAADHGCLGEMWPGSNDGYDLHGIGSAGSALGCDIKACQSVHAGGDAPGAPLSVVIQLADGASQRGAFKAEG